MIAGFEQPSEGTIRIEGADVAVAAPAPAADQHRLPELRPLPPPERRGQRRLRAEAQEGAEGRDRRAGRGRARAGRPRPPRRKRRPAQLSGGHAAAGGAGAGAGQPAQGAAARRAARRARPEAAQGAAGGAEADPARGRDHLRLRHPRPGGGADDERPDRGDEPRPGRAGRRSRGGLRAAGDDLRRRLHRRLQPDAGDRRRSRRGAARQRAQRSTRGRDGFAAGERCHAVVRPEKLHDRDDRRATAPATRTACPGSRGWSRARSTWGRRPRSSSTSARGCG